MQEWVQLYVKHEQARLKVAHYRQYGTGWRWDLFGQQLLTRILVSLASKTLSLDSSELEKFQ